MRWRAAVRQQTLLPIVVRWHQRNAAIRRQGACMFRRAGGRINLLRSFIGRAASFDITPRGDRMNKLFAKFANAAATAAGLPVAFLLAVAVIVAWAISGPFFGYSETWQLVINTWTTIITFLMVFVIQNA